MITSHHFLPGPVLPDGWQAEPTEARQRLDQTFRLHIVWFIVSLVIMLPVVGLCSADIDTYAKYQTPILIAITIWVSVIGVALFVINMINMFRARRELGRAAVIRRSQGRL